MTGYVYSGCVDEKLLMSLISDYFEGEETYHFSQSIELYIPKVGLPSEISSQGQVFSKKGEIRWEEENKGYRVILISESKFTAFPDMLTPLNDIWETEKNAIYLTPPDAPHVFPKFERYPRQADDNVPKLNIIVYSKEGRATFVSPRGFEL